MSDQRSGAWREFVAAVRADHQALCDHDERYGRGGLPRGRLATDLVVRIGFQMMVAYRLMRLSLALGIPLAPQIISRLIRHLYGSDIHWRAELEPGVTLVHGMGLCISSSARVGAGAILFQHVTLGESIHPETRAVGAPQLGRDVHVGPGATLVGPIRIGEGSKIAAGCLVASSVPPGSLVQAEPAVIRPREAPGMRRWG
jgi:serine O-acetyltransferase